MDGAAASSLRFKINTANGLAVFTHVELGLDDVPVGGLTSALSGSAKPVGRLPSSRILKVFNFCSGIFVGKIHQSSHGTRHPSECYRTLRLSVPGQGPRPAGWTRSLRRSDRHSRGALAHCWQLCCRRVFGRKKRIKSYLGALHYFRATLDPWPKMLRSGFRMKRLSGRDAKRPRKTRPSPG